MDLTERPFKDRDDYAEELASLRNLLKIMQQKIDAYERAIATAIAFTEDFKYLDALEALKGALNKTML